MSTSTGYQNDYFQKTKKDKKTVTVSAHLSVLVHASYQIYKLLHHHLILGLFSDMSLLCHFIIAAIIAPSLYCHNYIPTSKPQQ